MSSRSALGPVQAAVYQHLAGDVTLTSLAPVFDQVPEGTDFPYIQIAELSQEPDDTFGTLGRHILVTLFAWSSEPGFKQLDTIDDELRRLLDETEIPDVDPTDWVIFENQVILDEVSRDPDGIIRRLAVRCRVSVQKP